MRLIKPMFVVLILVGHITVRAQVAINTDASLPDASAMLDVKSTAKGVLVSRVTTAQRTAITTPADGLLVYDTDTKNFWYYKAGTGWQQIINSVGAVTLPYSATINSPSTLFSLTNLGDGASLEGISNSTTANITALRGIVSSTSPGSSSTAVRGMNNGTGGLGIGVWGSQEGSGWGVYGSVPNGVSVYGNATGSGWGVYANSSSGTALYANSNTGLTAQFANTNNSNNSNVVNVSNTGGGATVLVSTSGAGDGVNSTATAGGSGVNGFAGAISGAGVLGHNTGGGEAVTGLANTGTGIGAVVGRNDGPGYGVYGFISTDASGNAAAVRGTIGLNNSTGNAGSFANINASNGFPAVNVTTAGSGDGVNSTATAGGSGVNGFASKISGAGVLGHNTGGGEAVTGLAKTGAGIGAVVGRNDSAGYGVYGFISSDVTGNAAGVTGRVGLNNSTGNAGFFENINASNGFPAVNVTTAGSGDGVNSTATAGGSGVNGFASKISGAGVLGHNTGGGEAVTGLAQTGTGIGAVVGRNDGAGYGVYGFISGDVTGNAAGVTGRVGLNNSTGNAGFFENINASNGSPAVMVTTAGSGDGMSSTATNGGSGVNGFASKISGAGVLGHNTGGGEAVTGLAQTGTGIGAVVGRNDGAGYGVYGFISSDVTGNAAGVTGRVGLNNSTGNAGFFENINASNGSPAVMVTTAGSGDGVSSTATNGGSGVNGFASKISGAGVLGHNTGGGEAVTGLANTNTGIGAVVGRNDGSGYGVYGFISGNTSGNAAAVSGTIGFGGSTGRAGLFQNSNASNASNTVEVQNGGTGTALLVNHSGSSGNLAVFQNGGTNVARIDKNGACFFDGGFNGSGADLAEAFSVAGNKDEYEPGDVLVICTTSDRTLEKSTEPYSYLVAGVYATRPGVLLTEDKAENALNGKVPMGVVGVIPTKVCDENGIIRRGDILVTSHRPGYAMKANLENLKPGQSLGKALEELNGHTGKIKVLVNVK